MIALSDYLILAAILFGLSVAGIFLNRKNVIILLMAIELMLLAVNMNFIDRRPGIRVFYPDGGSGRGGDRTGDPGGAVPQPADH